ncbi:MAG: Lysyl-tRNA synthetase (class I) [uncultured Rubrobacteraceae bacterium]|uniref:Lysine--tRNA ligase n=1 Tax=uncultured Rubrobacteraceae bacterium TaxID=349277 RepID=A0A6J4SI31_9ACTN|nr:MAG: Lysyl-tRNA synthetase (class I) [uncultured Rubrobacteraceae bacterium]
MAETGIPVPLWAEKVADGLGTGPHVVVTGISPSGHIHNLREVLVAEAVANALRARGEPVRFLFHADTIDPLRKIAPGVPEGFKEYFGYSLSRVPDPEGCHASYAEHFLVPFEEALHEMGMDIGVLRSHELYEAGLYTDVTREAIEHTEELRDILQEASGRQMPGHWSPYLPRRTSGQLTGARVLEHLPERHSVVYADEDGFEETADYSKGEGKLGWRVELAARWKALGVTFEPFGKDHTSRGGSTDTADRMSREVFHYPIPGRFEYEWNYIKGKGAMSSSGGIVLMPDEMLRIMPPNALRRMFLGRDPARALEMDPGEGFPRFMDEFNAEHGGIDVPFGHLALVAQTVGENVDAAAAMLERGGYEEAARDRERLARDLSYARNWARDWAPESMRIGLLPTEESREALAALDEEQRAYLADVSAKLRPGMDGDEAQDLLYSTAVGRGLKPKRAFAAVYKVLLGKTSGPKAGPFVAGLPLEEVRRRFSGL